MKCGTLLAALALVGGQVLVRAAVLRTTPMARVASLLREMEARIQADGRLEQMSYDKYACWCEDTLGRKAKDISTAKVQIQDLQTHIIQLKGETASHGAEIKQLHADIAANLESQQEATAVRQKGNAEFEAEKMESEQCIGALEAAINVLTGAGTGKGFLETLQEAQVISVVGGIRSVLGRRPAQSVSNKDLELVKRFVEHPAEFLGSRASGGFLSAVQIANNPFGDYAPQSTQIQGVLKGMYDAFAADLEKDNAEEAEAQKSFEELMATKKQELDTLQATLEQQQLDEAEKTKTMADSNELMDDTKVQLAADEAFFDETKAGCKEKAWQWSERTRLRTEELAGVGKAIQILTSEEAVRIFENSTTTLVQVASAHRSSDSARRVDAFARMADLAQQFHSYGLSKVAVQLKAGGHFDKVIASIDAMMEVLRREEQDDIAHRDRCQGAENKNKNDKEDLNHAVGKANSKISRLNQKAGDLKAKIGTLETEISSTKADMKDALDMRNDAVAEFRQALKDDADAVALLDQTMVALTRFYKKNDIPLALIKAAPEYTVDKDKAPTTSWSGPGYGGRSSETEGIMAILEMIKEDVQKEMQTSQEDNAKAQQQYEKERGAMQATLDAQVALKLATEKELAEVEGKRYDTEEFRDAKSADLSAEEELSNSIYSDCSWVATHFESRRTKRKTEMDGLVEAKSYLAGVESGDTI